MSEEQAPPYRVDVINGAIGAQGLTNQTLAAKAGTSPKTISAIRNGQPNVGLPLFQKVVEALGLTMEEVFRKAAA